MCVHSGEGFSALCVCVNHYGDSPTYSHTSVARGRVKALTGANGAAVINLNGRSKSSAVCHPR